MPGQITGPYRTWKSLGQKSTIDIGFSDIQRNKRYCISRGRSVSLSGKFCDQAFFWWANGRNPFPRSNKKNAWSQVVSWKASVQQETPDGNSLRKKSTSCPRPYLACSFIIWVVLIFDPREKFPDSGRYLHTVPTHRCPSGRSSKNHNEFRRNKQKKWVDVSQLKKLKQIYFLACVALAQLISF